MFGLAHPCRRGAPPADSAGVGDALQSWTTALIPRTWDSGTAPSQGSGRRPPTRTPEGLSRRLEVSARRLMENSPGADLHGDKDVQTRKVAVTESPARPRPSAPL